MTLAVPSARLIIWLEGIGGALSEASGDAWTGITEASGDAWAIKAHSRGMAVANTELLRSISSVSRYYSSLFVYKEDINL
jgi:hypothetical protein